MATRSTTATSAAARPATTQATTWSPVLAGRASPPGIKKAFPSTTEFSLAIIRTQLCDANDMDNVVKVQSGYKVRPLSAFLGQPAPPAPPGPEEEGIRAKLATIGVGPGKTFAFKDLSAEHKAAVLLGMKEGEKKVEEAVAQIGKSINGWYVGSAFGDRAYYSGNWLLRAAAAKAGIYGNHAAEAMYPMVKTLSDGTALDGSKARYTLTFAKDQYPPVNAFWSVTMYDGKTQLLVKNPIDRYLINSPMLPGMNKNADGSLTIYVQKDSPGKDKQANWLPTPDGPIYMVMRFYWPKTGPPSILPPGGGGAVTHRGCLIEV